MKTSICLKSEKDLIRVNKFVHGADHALITDANGLHIVLCHGAENGMVKFNGSLMSRETLLNMLSPAMAKAETNRIGLLCCFAGNGPEKVQMADKTMETLVNAKVPVFVEGYFVADDDDRFTYMLDLTW